MTSQNLPPAVNFPGPRQLSLTGGRVAEDGQQLGRGALRVPPVLEEDVDRVVEGPVHRPPGLSHRPRHNCSCRGGKYKLGKPICL